MQQPDFKNPRIVNAAIRAHEKAVLMYYADGQEFRVEAFMDAVRDMADALGFDLVAKTPAVTLEAAE